MDLAQILLPVPRAPHGLVVESLASLYPVVRYRKTLGVTVIQSALLRPKTPWSRHFAGLRVGSGPKLETPMRPVLFLMLIAPLAGCAAAMPGYSPDGPANMPAALRPFKGGAMDNNGRYVVSPEERALTCPKLTGSMQVIMSRLKDTDNRPRAAPIASAMQAAAKPLVGQGANLDIDEEVKTARARLKAYNDLLAEKKCKTLDIAGA